MKKLWTNRILALAAVCGLAACTTGTQPAAFTWENASIERNDANCEIKMTYPVAKGGGAAADSVNELIARMLTAGFDEQGGDMAGYTVARAVDSLIAQKGRSEVMAGVPFQLMSHWSVFQKGALSSLYLENYAFTGGAHGMTIGSYLNFEGTRSTPLTVEQMFTDTTRLSELNRAAFAEFLKTRGGEEEVGMYLFVQPDALPLPMNIGFDSTGVVMLYNQYEIAAYVFGQSLYALPWAEVDPILGKAVGGK